jgi:hypothetical protein
MSQLNRYFHHLTLGNPSAHVMACAHYPVKVYKFNNSRMLSDLQIRCAVV